MVIVVGGYGWFVCSMYIVLCRVIYVLYYHRLSTSIAEHVGQCKGNAFLIDYILISESLSIPLPEDIHFMGNVITCDCISGQLSF
jgi:hypothetical protein